MERQPYLSLRNRYSSSGELEKVRKVEERKAKKPINQLRKSVTHDTQILVLDLVRAEHLIMTPHKRAQTFYCECLRTNEQDVMEGTGAEWQLAS